MTSACLFRLGLIFMMAGSAAGQITRVATFENFNEGQPFKPSFVDPLSGIAFRDSTHPFGGFCIEYSTTEFGGGNYLNAGGYAPGPGASWSSYFGFVGDLPMPANRVTIDVSCPLGDTSTVMLQGMNGLGITVAQQAGPSGAPRPFTLEVSSAAFEISSFRVTAGAAIDTAYDNVSYTIVPEPSTALFIAAAALLRRARRRRR